MGGSVMELAELALEHLAGRVGDRFVATRAVDGGEGRSEQAFELIEASALSAATAPPDALRGPFRLIFRGPREAFFSQGILALEHAELGRLEIFLVPIGPDAQGMRYEAIFT